MTSLNVADLIEEFSDGAIKHHELSIKGKYQKANEQARRIDAAFKELVKQGQIGRDALLSLTDSSVPEVALMAATYSLRYAPEKCKLILNKLSEDSGLIGFGASQALLRWEEGAWNLE